MTNEIVTEKETLVTAYDKIQSIFHNIKKQQIVMLNLWIAAANNCDMSFEERKIAVYNASHVAKSFDLDDSAVELARCDILRLTKYQQKT